NKAWLEKLGLTTPETTEELYEALIAFRDQDPNGTGLKDEITMTARAGLVVVNMMSGAFGLDQQLGYNINIDNDQVQIWMGDERNK
ncbi:ABC transporter substrate-binding protein, partial [Listeria monocytogenes]|nr:ABC transporter substrate-binding protein [Listeria monocytogenes]